MNYLAVLNRLPSVYTLVRDAGSLFFYGANTELPRRRAGYYIDAILRGIKPGELAVELATTFDLVVNLKTAKALGITIPQSVLFQATELIQ